MAEIALGSARDAIRWGLLLSAVAVAGFRLPRTYGAFRGWREVRLSDPSAGELERLTFTSNAVAMAIILLLAIGVFYLLRPRRTKQP
jgi:ABC-type cobalt transport system substrate-binding protein